MKTAAPSTKGKCLLRKMPQTPPSMVVKLAFTRVKLRNLTFCPFLQSRRKSRSRRASRRSTRSWPKSSSLSLRSCFPESKTISRLSLIRCATTSTKSSGMSLHKLKGQTLRFHLSNCMKRFSRVSRHTAWTNSATPSAKWKIKFSAKSLPTSPRTAVPTKMSLQRCRP